MKRLFLILLICFSALAKAEFIDIGILVSKNVQSFDFSIRAGKYALFTKKGKIKEFESGVVLNIQLKGDLVLIKTEGNLLGTYEEFSLVGTGWYNHFLIKTISPDGLVARYDDNLKVAAIRNKLQIVNNIDLDNYVAGVVEAEVGRKPPKEYFKLQAIICRTYALSNTHKHLFEGYNLCDEVHCQAYHGKSFFSDIVDASMQTKGAVIVDSNIDLITAAFHSNCGGETVNSEDVWSNPLYYLRSVRDTFCIHKKNAVWEKRLNAQNWKRYLTAYAPDNVIDSNFKNDDLSKRRIYIMNSKLSYEDIRTHFKLRSTFFTATDMGQDVLLKGKGYGHGVGLCQEGAMEMAAQGYDYSEILHFYYSGVHIIDLSALDFFKED